MTAATARNSALVSLAIGGAAFLIDRVHKYVQLDMMGWTGGEFHPVTGFFDYVLVWNTGVSYGLLSGVPWYVMAAIIVGAMALLVGWWIRDKALTLRIALALCLGGAASNAVDRLLYGAVADFFHLHVGSWSFYVFNIADVAITCGAILLVVDVLFGSQETKV